MKPADSPLKETSVGIDKQSYGPRRDGEGGDTLQPSIEDWGLDAGGMWQCQRDAASCLIPLATWAVNSSVSTPDAATMAAFRYPGPVYVIINVVESLGPDVDLRYSVDGSPMDCAAPAVPGPRHCSFVSGSAPAVQVARHVTYGGKERIVLYAVTGAATWTAGWTDGNTPSPIPNQFVLQPCSTLQLLLCTNGSGGNVTSFNVSSALGKYADNRIAQHSDYLGPLQPGPKTDTLKLVC